MLTVNSLPANEHLSVHQTAALWLMSHGYTCRTIGDVLGEAWGRTISEVSARQTLRRVYRKLKAVDRAHAVRLGFELEILSPCVDGECAACARDSGRAEAKQG